MNYLLTPASCPKCSESLQLTYPERRYSRLHAAAILLRAIIIAIVVLLTPISFILARDFIALTTDGAGLHWREQGLLFLVTYVLALVVLFLLAWLCWRFTSKLPRRTNTTCRACGWSGSCLVREAWL